MFGAVDYPIVAIACCGALHATHIRASVGFRHRQALDAFTSNRRNQIFVYLLISTGAQNIAGSRDNVMQRIRCRAEFTVNECRVKRVEATATKFARHVACVDACVN